jgi:protein O-mannosyl-transferase
LKKLFAKSSFALIVITLFTVIIYSNIYQSSFVFDDGPGIQENLDIRSVGNYLSVDRLLKPRGIVNLTFALNYRLGKLNVFGYHLINVLIHIINGFLVYFLSLTVFKQLSPSFIKPFGSLNGPNSKLKRSTSKERHQGSKTGRKQKSKKAQPLGCNEHPVSFQSSIPWMSLVAALIFVTHPIQTQAVTYTVQRFASMAAMFYLASVFFYLKARIMVQSSKLKAQRSGRYSLSAFFGLSIVCGMLAFLSKQNTASLPGVILLSEYLLIDRTWEGWKRKIPWFALAFALWIFFVFYVAGFFSGGIGGQGLLEDVSRLTQETENVSRWSYLCTQFNVLVIYIRLLFLPIGQNLDYLYPFKTGFFDGNTPLAFAFLIGLIAIGIWNVRKRPIICFGIFWFFITLSVESSIIPIRDALFEHRLYLPMFGFAIVVSYLVFHLLSKRVSWLVAISVIIILCLGAATYLRNITWQDNTNLWSDVVSKNFYNYRAHNNLGIALGEQGRTEEAVEHYLQALRIKPDHVEAHNNLGVALDKQGRTNEAIEHYLQALRIKPDHVETHNNLGVALVKQGRTNEAIEHYLQALRIKPDHVETHNNLGVALDKQGRTNEAIEHYLQALRIKPDYVEAHSNLGVALDKQGRTEEAIEHFLQVLRIKPDHVEVQYNLGNALNKQGRTEEAVKHFLQVLRIKPDFDQAHNSLAIALLRKGNIEGAIAHFQKSLSINPDDINAKNNLKNALMVQQKNSLGNTRNKQGRTDEAIEQYLRALRIKPDDVEAHNNLGVALNKQGRTEEAIEHYLQALRIKPDYVDAHYNLGNALNKQGRTGEAIQHFLQVLRIRPDFDQAHNNLAIALFRKGDIEGAIAHFRKSLSINPDNINVKKNLKKALMIQQENQ